MAAWVGTAVLNGTVVYCARGGLELEVVRRGSPLRVVGRSGFGVASLLVLL